MCYGLSEWLVEDPSDGWEVRSAWARCLSVASIESLNGWALA